MKIAVIPRFATLLDNEIFEYGDYTPLQHYGVDRPGFAALKKRLEDDGHQIATIDHFQNGDIDICVFVDMNYYYLHKLLQRDDPPKLVFMMREPPTAKPFNSAATIRSYLPIFDRVLSWNDELAAEHDRIVEYKLPYCHTDTRYDERLQFSNRKLLVNVSSRKHSTHPNELYSARKQIIGYYEQNYPEEFTLYGRGWDERSNLTELCHGKFFPEQYSCYGGLVEDKLDAYLDHRFALSFENISNISGYVTEKIFDCFRAGTVPVYWGATNIAEYVPKEAFVDYREFVSPAELHDHLTSMSQSEYEKHLAAAQSFIKTDHPFTATAFAQQVGEALLTTPKTDDDVPDHLLDDIEEHAQLSRMMYDPTDVPLTEFVCRWLRLLRSNPKLLVRKPQATYFGLRRLLPGKIGEIR